MTHASLFSGIGGFDLAAAWMGWENVFHCEWNAFGQKVLKYHFPKSICYHDITKTDFTIHRGAIDVLTGGFPCQPYSLAGQRKGTEDERHLWPEMLRAVREIQPRWVVGENVLGLVNWNGGQVFDEVQADLEAAGYEVWPYVLPACAVDAPHRRDRVWFVAYNASYAGRVAGNRGQSDQSGQSIGDRQNAGRKETPDLAKRPCAQGFDTDTTAAGFESLRSDGQNEVYGFETIADTYGSRRTQQCIPEIANKSGNFNRFGNEGYADSDTCNTRLQGSTWKPGPTKKGESFRHDSEHVAQSWDNWPTQPPVCNGNNGLSSRLDGITFSKWRNESIKAGGNAIVPQVAVEIFKAMQAYEALNP